MYNRIPGGLIDKSTEFFSVMANGQMEPYCNHCGGTYDFMSMPDTIKAIAFAEMKALPAVERGIETMVGNNIAEKTKKFISCRYGAINADPDIDTNGNLSEPEYVPCDNRGKCAFEGTVCTSILFSHGIFLSKAETQVFKLVELPDKIIGSKLFISVQTVKKHFQNIRIKTGLNNKVEMAVWATKKGII